MACTASARRPCAGESLPEPSLFLRRGWSGLSSPCAPGRGRTSPPCNQALKEDLEAQYAWEQDVAVSNVMSPSGEEYDQQLYSRAPLAGGETALVLSACQEEGPSGMATLWIELRVEPA